MIKQAFLEAAAGCEPYTPNDQVLEQASGIDLVAAMGPSGAGKNTLIAAAGLPKVISDTSRDPRTSAGEVQGDPYNFLADEDYEATLAAIQAGENVQIKIHSYTGEYYGSHIRAYPAEGVAAIDVVLPQYTEFAASGLFKTVTGIYLLPPSLEVLEQRRDARAILSPDEIQKRRDEGFASISGALEVPGVQFVINDTLELALEAFSDIASGRGSSEKYQTKAQSVAETILADMITQQA